MIRNGVIAALDGCYELLSPVGFPFGYRTAKEVFVYIYVWIKSRQLLGSDAAALLAEWPEALDKAVLQKVLPKIHGSKRSWVTALKPRLRSWVVGTLVQRHPLVTRSALA